MTSSLINISLPSHFINVSSYKLNMRTAFDRQVRIHVATRRICVYLSNISNFKSEDNGNK